MDVDIFASSTYLFRMNDIFTNRSESSWNGKNIGYETPYDSTIMASGMQFGNEGDFRADVIEITLENHSGGSQRACLIRRGEI